MALQFSNNNNDNIMAKRGKQSADFINSFMQQTANPSSSNSTSSFDKFMGNMNSGGNTQSPSQSTGSFGNYEDYKKSQESFGGGMRTADIQDSDGDRIDDRDQGGAGQPRFMDNPDFYSGGGGSGAPTESLGGDTSTDTSKYAAIKEKAEKYKSYMSSKDGTEGWGSQDKVGNSEKIGPSELAAMREESGFSKNEINDFFSSEEGRGYLSKKSQNQFDASQVKGESPQSPAQPLGGDTKAQEYKDNFMGLGDRTQADNNSGLVGDGTKMDDNTGNIGDFNAQDSYNTDINSTTGESGQGGIDNTNIKSPFEVSGDLTNDIGNQSQNDYNFSNSTVGAFAKIGNDYSVTIGNIGNGNNVGSGSDSGQGSNAPMNFMQTAAAYGALNTNAQQKSSDQLNGLERGIIGAGMAPTLTNSNNFAANAYNNAAAAAQNFRNRAAVGEDKLYGNTDFDLSGWSPLKSPKKPEDKTQEIADSFN